ncbi:hypothetical protein BKA61DRAFT_212029 [Leptodontidium sp. MPI-SDFR-AT-0119]|nr:hypothetical protein BKA61DRAFT_212029 [Leptodontidium sp. MPI-SDFR-AT-0119]
MPLLYGEGEVKAFQRLREAIDRPLKDRPETPPNPSIVIPFSRDTDFVERGILDQIHHELGHSQGPRHSCHILLNGGSLRKRGIIPRERMGYYSFATTKRLIPKTMCTAFSTWSMIAALNRATTKVCSHCIVTWSNLRSNKMEISIYSALARTSTIPALAIGWKYLAIMRPLLSSGIFNRKLWIDGHHPRNVYGKPEQQQEAYRYTFTVGKNWDGYEGASLFTNYIQEFNGQSQGSSNESGSSQSPASVHPKGHSRDLHEFIHLAALLPLYRFAITNHGYMEGKLLRNWSKGRGNWKRLL